ncbi:NADP-dependent 3-hydroxy acid dehydrogenase [Paramyrothecium foliicola]|nr:NADP-dependent 3-hydroxy acid dehydrogenase [Paramyrothecium foliicola]
MSRCHDPKGFAFRHAKAMHWLRFALWFTALPASMSSPVESKYGTKAPAPSSHGNDKGSTSQQAAGPENLGGASHAAHAEEMSPYPRNSSAYQRVAHWFSGQPLNETEYRERNWMWIRCRTRYTPIFDVGGAWTENELAEWKHAQKKANRFCPVTDWRVKYYNGQGWGDAEVTFWYPWHGCTHKTAARAVHLELPGVRGYRTKQPSPNQDQGQNQDQDIQPSSGLVSVLRTSLIRTPPPPQAPPPQPKGKGALLEIRFTTHAPRRRGFHVASLSVDCTISENGFKSGYAGTSPPTPLRAHIRAHLESFYINCFASLRPSAVLDALSVDPHIPAHPPQLLPTTSAMSSSSLSAAGQRLAGKTILITGASSGIGRSTAREFARTCPTGNLRIILAARRVDELQSLAADIKADVGDGVQVLPAKLDVSDPEAVRSFVPGLPEEWRDIHVLVNNAGLVKGVARAPEIAEEDMNVMFNTNVTGLVNMTQAILPIFLKRPNGGQGDIVNIGSIAGREPYPGGAIYCATKAAVHSISDALRKELIATRVRVIEVDPGQVETNFSVVRFYGDKAKADAVYSGCEPLTPDDVAEVIVFTVSRRENVIVADTLLFPNHQASALIMHRKSS